MMYIDAFCYGLDDFPEVPLQLRQHLMECLREDGVESLAAQLKELDPVSYEDLPERQRYLPGEEPEDDDEDFDDEDEEDEEDDDEDGKEIFDEGEE